MNDAIFTFWALQSFRPFLFRPCEVWNFGTYPSQSCVLSQSPARLPCPMH